MNKQAVLSLSGGMDSSTVLLHLLANGYDVTAVSFDYGQKHRVELERAQQLVDYINNNQFTTVNDGQMKLHNFENQIKYQVIKLDGLVSLLDSNLVEGGAEVPEGHYEEENMKDTVVPNRNKMFSSIIQAIALSIANTKNCPVEIAMGIHAGDHAIYPDCRQEFRDIDTRFYQYFVMQLDSNTTTLLGPTSTNMILGENWVRSAIVYVKIGNEVRRLVSTVMFFPDNNGAISGLEGYRYGSFGTGSGYGVFIEHPNKDSLDNAIFDEILGCFILN